MRGRLRRLSFLLASALLVLLLADVSRPPGRQFTVKTAVAGLHVYRRVASPLLARLGVRCRFQPTCSRYAEGALERDGLIKGSWRSARRLLRCGPWTPMGTRDEL